MRPFLRIELATILAFLLSTMAGTPSYSQDGNADITVELRNIKFYPNRIKAKKGDRVRFINRDKFDHDVYIVRTVNLRLVVTDVTRLKAGQDTYVTLKEDGVFDLYCTIHGGMEGKITIYEVGPRIKDDLRLPVPFRSAPEWLASARATEGRSSPAR